MKTRKIGLLLLLTLLLVSLAVFSVACGDEPDTPDTPTPAEKTEFTVTFTGDGLLPTTQTITKGGTALRPKDPEKTGYTFAGWFVEGSDTAYDFTTPVTSDLTLVARFTEATGVGTKENPYLIKTAEDLVVFADRINHPDEDDNAKYLDAYFRLAADIDMTGRDWTPAGQVVTVNEGEEGEVTYHGFSGTFDGAGHKITNLKVTKLLRSSVYYLGLFGVTEHAEIRDLTLENIDYSVESGGNNDAIGVGIGGVVGRANLTNLYNVRVTGTVAASLCEKNTAFIGGLVGEYSVSSAKQAYIAYVEGCSAAIEIKNRNFDDGEKSVMETVAAGGIFGSLTSYNCAAAIVDCSVTGKVTGGNWAGGIIGYVSGSYTTLVNCANYATVRATSKDATYAGGILGTSNLNNVIMDCVSMGDVRGVAASSGTYKSYAGGIVGFSAADDYDVYYSAGTAVINCYYKGKVQGYDIRNAWGTEKTGDFALDADFAEKTLGWEYMVIGADGIALPVKRDNADTVYHLTLRSGDSRNDLEKPYKNGVFSLVGEPGALPNAGTDLFFDWEHESGVRYRFFIPVVKDMTLTARFHSSEGIEGIYAGTATLYETKDAGALKFNADGTLQWINSTVTAGKYTWDGYHILFTFYDNTGAASGTFSDGKVYFLLDAGMSGNVSYVFTPSALRFVGEYLSEDGDTLSFAGETRVTFRSENVKGGKDISGTFTYDAESRTLTFSGMSEYFTTATATENTDGTLTLHFTSKGDKGKDIDGVRFAIVAEKNYADLPLIGTYYVPSVSQDAEGDVSQSDSKIEFRADGTVAVTGTTGSVSIGSYYALKNGTYLIMTVNGHTSYLRYNAECGVVYGGYNLGTYTKNYAIMTPVSEGTQRNYVVNGNLSKLIVTDAHTYLVWEGTFRFSPAVSAPDGYGDRARVTVDGVDYLVVDCYDYNRFDQLVRTGTRLMKVGAEEGTYRHGTDEVKLDGIGNATGTRTGRYWVYGTQVVVLFDDDGILVFDHTVAQAAGGTVTEIAGDGYRGVWYLDRDKTDDEGNSYTVKKYMKLVADGIGHIAVLYYREYEQSYAFNWGGNTWGTYTEVPAGLYVEFNSSQKITFTFYYGGRLAYARGGIIDRNAFYAEGYTGAMTPPTLPAESEGKYTGTRTNGDSVVFNLNRDLTGTYNGVAFTAIYDGDTRVIFTAGGVACVFRTDTLMLTVGEEQIRLTSAGAVTEKIPASMCGTFSGTWTGANGGVRTVVIEADGTVTYFDNICFTNVTYEVERGTLKATTEVDGETYTITLTWNAEKGSYSGYVNFTYDGEETRAECQSLTRNA